MLVRFSEKVGSGEPIVTVKREEGREGTPKSLFERVEGRAELELEEEFDLLQRQGFFGTRHPAQNFIEVVELTFR